MQIDLHYYATYVLAIAAGFDPETARRIATAAQYVDDNAAPDSLVLKDGARIAFTATAHHPADLENLSQNDQRQVWVPFHFLPGGGDATVAYDHRLVCSADSGVSADIRQYAIDHFSQPFGPELLGIVSHVVADTFSHQGFSGVSSPLNRVDQRTIRLDPSGLVPHSVLDYIRAKAEKFLERFIGKMADDVSALGHGAVATYPDRPYLEWQYRRDFDGATIRCDNVSRFTDGCAVLFAMFRAVTGAARQWDSLAGAVRTLLRTPGDVDARIAAWQTQADSLCGVARVPDYDARALHAATMALRSQTSDAVRNHPIIRFHQAAELYRAHVLNRLLPSVGVLIG